MSTLHLRRFVWLIFALAAGWAIVTIPYAALDLRSLGDPGLVIAVSFPLGVILLYLAAKAIPAIDRGGAAVSSLIAAVPARWFLPAVIAAGIYLRALWIGHFPLAMQSDAANYFALAKGLFENGVYQDAAGYRAALPPGYPLFLYACFAVFGVHAWVPIVANVVLFGVTVCLVYKLAQEVADEHVARLAVLLFALWPNHIFSSGYPMKETVVTALLPLALLCYVRSAAEGSRPGKKAWLAFVTGLALGFASLTQPAAMLLPVILVIDAFLRNDAVPARAARLFAVALGMLVAIGPWAVRNYTVFHKLIPVSTLGGDVFYRANNPWASGSFETRGERSLEPYGELEKSSVGYRWGLEWITSHPMSFLYLAVKKQIAFLGNDDTGIHFTFRQRIGSCSGPCEAWWKVTNVYWWAVCVLLFASWKARTGLMRSTNMLLLGMVFLYFLAIHSVFESGTRHHVQLYGVLAILAAAFVYPVRKTAAAPI